MQTKSMEVEGISMRWEEEGEGAPVVYIHGIPTSPRLWRYVIPQVHEARSLAWEMVGYGGSMREGRDRDISVAKQAEYLAAWRQELGLEKALLLGHDLGGGVAQILAVNNPELVRGLVLTNVISYDSWPIPSVKAMRAMGPAVERLPDAILRYNLYVGLFLRGHDDRVRAKESFGEHFPYYERADGAAALVRQTRSLNVQDTLAVSDRIPDLDVPARIVWGAADQFQKIGYGYRLAYELGAPLDRVEGGKHFLPEDHPDRVAATVNALLEQAA
ncbi:MAG TPA: alpha/beta hydrolase [Rubrobacteraceae bacterium]|nr:alpha/beta hydrolase [Rubrobacteraceae bacterium]